MIVGYRLGKTHRKMLNFKAVTWAESYTEFNYPAPGRSGKGFGNSLIVTVAGQATAASAVASRVVILTDSDGYTSLRLGVLTASIQGTPIELGSSAIIVGIKTNPPPLPRASMGLGACSH